MEELEEEVVVLLLERANTDAAALGAADGGPGNQAFVPEHFDSPAQKNALWSFSISSLTPTGRRSADMAYVGRLERTMVMRTSLPAEENMWHFQPAGTYPPWQ